MKARAHVNFALIKYWGKKDDERRIPHQASLSFTVDKLYTDTLILFDTNLKKDNIIINGNINLEAEKRVVNYLNLLRKELNVNTYVHFNSNNNVPTAAGLASSASSFASIALAFSKEAGLDLSKEELSRLARLGSGSASRSIYSNFAIWNTGNDQTSVAKPLNINWPEFRIIVLMIDKNKKRASSTNAMEISVKNEKLYPKWVKESTKDLNEMIDALNQKDIDLVGKIAERNSNHMHDLIESTKITYKTKDSIKAIKRIESLREKGISAYYTMDAGPNIKIITTDKYVSKILEEFNDLETIVCKSGKEAHIIE